MLLQLGADDAELAGDVGAAGADLVLARDHVELVPGVAAVHNTLGAQDHAVSALVQRVQGLVQILTAVFVGRLLAPAREHLVGVVVVVVMMPAGADAVLVVVVLMVMLVLVLVVVVMAAVVVVVIVIMVVMVVLVLVLIVIMVVMVMLVLVLIVVLVVMMMAAAVVVVLIVVVMVMMVVLVLILVGMGHVGGASLGQQLGDEVALAVHDGDDLCAGQDGPVGGDDGGGGVLLGQQGDGGSDLLLTGVAGAAQDDAGRMADLVVIELTEVLHIHLDLVHVGDGDKAVQDDGQILGDALDGAGHVGQLADARRLNEDAVRVVGLDDLLQCLAEITDQAAADAAGVQLIDLNAGLTHEAAVDADLAEFVLDQDDLLTGEGLLDELFDKGGLAGAEEAGENVDFGFLFSHSWVPLFKMCSDVQLVGNLLH